MCVSTMERIDKRAKPCVPKHAATKPTDKDTGKGNKRGTNFDNINFFLSHPKKNKVIAYHIGVLPAVISDRLHLLGCTLRNVTLPLDSSPNDNSSRKEGGRHTQGSGDTVGRFRDVDLFIYKKTPKQMQSSHVEKANTAKQVSFTD